jgi:hypothetical protein
VSTPWLKNGVLTTCRYDSQTYRHRGEDGEPEDEVQGIDTRGDTYRDALVESLQNQNRFLREELARKNAILMRQLTAPAEVGREDAPGSLGSPSIIKKTPTEDTGEQGKGSDRPDSEAPWSWWRGMFGG